MGLLSRFPTNVMVSMMVATSAFVQAARLGLSKPLSPLPRRSASPATCLHGLRGLAACAVFLRHMLVSFFAFPDQGSIHEETVPIRQLLRRFPLLRLPFAGNAMVCVFFVVSGYLDSKPLRLIRAEDWAGLQGHLASGILRRGPRLFIPALAASTILAVAIWLGLYEWGLEYRLSFFDGLPPQVAREASLFKQLWRTWRSFMELFNVWSFRPILPAVNLHYWTLPYDFRATCIRYLTILCSSRLSTVGRTAVTVAVICFCAAWGRWEVVLNLCGALLYEVDLATGWLGRASTDMAFSGRKVASRRTRWICALLLTISVYLCCFPKQNGKQTPGFRILSRLAPNTWEDYRYWNSWAALMIVWAVLHHDGVSRFLEGSVPQYLGSISFAMYLLHGPVLNMTAFALVPMMWRTGVLGRTLGFLAPVLLVVVPSVVLAADLFTRTIESRIYKLIRGLERVA